MSTYNTNQFKSGLKIILDGDPYTIVENEFVKPGKGQAFNRLKVRNLKNGRVIEKTFKSGDSVEAADVMEVEMQYLYSDGEFWHFMNPKSYEQLQADEAAMTEALPWLREQDICLVTLWNDAPLAVEVTVTEGPAAAKPQTWALAGACCSTMWSPCVLAKRKAGLGLR